MRVAIMGAGGIGGSLGALLARHGHDVTLIARGEHLEALRAKGLSLRSPVVGDVSVHPAATDRCEDVGQVDLALVCVKTYDLEEAALQLRPLIGLATAVLPLQNGVDAAERVGRAIPPQHVLAGAIYDHANREAPGVVATAVGSAWCSARSRPPDGAGHGSTVGPWCTCHSREGAVRLSAALRTLEDPSLRSG